MTTTTWRNNYHEADRHDLRQRLIDARQRQASADAGRTAALDALERAGELALAGLLAESRAMARKFEEATA